MNIKIEDYLSEDEIKSICKEVLKQHILDCVGNVSVSTDKGRVFVTKLAQKLAKEGVQEIIPNFKELINEQIESQIKSVKLSDFFVHSFGWNNIGNKILNEVLFNNKHLLDAKVKEIFKTIDK